MIQSATSFAKLILSSPGSACSLWNHPTYLKVFGISMSSSFWIQNQFRRLTFCVEAFALSLLPKPGKVTSKDCLLLKLLILRPQSSEPSLTGLKIRDPISAAMSYPKTFLIFYNHSVAVQLISPIHHPHQPLKSSRVMTKFIIFPLVVPEVSKASLGYESRRYAYFAKLKKIPKLDSLLVRSRFRSSQPLGVSGLG